MIIIDPVTGKKSYRYPEKLKEWSANNREKFREYRKRWKEKNPDLHEACQISYRKRNRDKINLKARQFRETHRTYYAEYLKEWRKENPEKNRAHMHKRLARRFGAPGAYTDKDVSELFIAQSARCFYCCIDLTIWNSSGWHIDHKIPLSKGGTNYKENICIACESCNCRKQSLSIETFMLRLLTE